MVRHCEYHVIKHLNTFPTKNGVTDDVSPNTIITGSSGIYLSQDGISFGAYAMVYVGTDNKINLRAVPGIALSSSNGRGGYYFMNLYSDAELHSKKWKELPISDNVIHCVQQVAKDQKQPLLRD